MFSHASYEPQNKARMAANLYLRRVKTQIDVGQIDPRYGFLDKYIPKVHISTPKKLLEKYL